MITKTGGSTRKFGTFLFFCVVQAPVMTHSLPFFLDWRTNAHAFLSSTSIRSNNSSDRSDFDNRLGRCNSEGCATVAGFVLQNLEQAADPCQDFYKYACGKFIANSWLSSAFSKPKHVRDTFNQRTQNVIDDVLANNQKTSPAEQKTAQFYAACTAAPQTVTFQSSLQFVHALMNEVGGFFVTSTARRNFLTFQRSSWSIEDAMLRVLPYLTSLGLWTIGIHRDDFNSSRYALTLSPAETSATLLLNADNHLRPKLTGSSQMWPIDRMKPRRVSKKLGGNTSPISPSYRNVYIRFLRRLTYALMNANGNSFLENEIDEFALLAIADFEYRLTNLSLSTASQPTMPPALSLTRLDKPAADLHRLCPYMDWAKIGRALAETYKVHAFSDLAEQPRTNEEKLVIYTTSTRYLVELCVLLKETMMRPMHDDGASIIQSYLAVQTLMPFLGDLAQNFRQPYVQFVYEALAVGIKSQQQGNSPLQRVDSTAENKRTKRAADIDVINGSLPPSIDFTQMIPEEVSQRCRTMATEVFGDVLSRKFVERYFKRSAKAKATRMAEDVREQLLENFESRSWMDAKTKRNARKKAEQILIDIGYSDLLLDKDETSGVSWVEERFRDLDVSRNHLVNLVNVAKYTVKRELSRLDKFPNRKEWGILAIENNAEYDFNENAVHVTAATANDPFFRVDFPVAWNYGSLGYTVGHELTHSIDWSGAFYDERGNIVGDWWSDATKGQFRRRAQCMARQYARIPLSMAVVGTDSPPMGNASGMRIDGENTLDENVADNGGLKLAYRAMKKRIGSAELKQPVLPGLDLTNEQLFFVSVAQSFCQAISEPVLLHQLVFDEHAPENARVKGMMMNSVEWSTAFNCPHGSPMNPVRKCHVW